MDKIIEKKTGWRVAFTKKALPWWLGALLAAFIIYLIARPNNKTLRVDKDTITVSTAVKGEFNDYIRISGRVQPMTTIQLSPQEGGIVEPRSRWSSRSWTCARTCWSTAHRWTA